VSNQASFFDETSRRREVIQVQLDVSRRRETLPDYRRQMISAVQDAGTQKALAAEDPAWREDAERAIEELAASGFAFTAEDVRTRIGSPYSPGAMGAAFLQASRRRLIRRVGFVAAQRIERHGAVVAQWIGVERAP
jgi:hypothetical protein